MSEALLVQVISLLCLQPNVELRIDCFEKYTNCAVVSEGKILTMREFQVKCVKAK